MTTEPELEQLIERHEARKLMKTHELMMLFASRVQQDQLHDDMDQLLAMQKADQVLAVTSPFFGRDVYLIVTTDIDRTTCHERADAIFAEDARQFPGIRELRVDTYTFTHHPVPDTDITFDLYVKAIIVGKPNRRLHEG